MTAKPLPTRWRRPSQTPRGESSPTTSIRTRSPKSRNRSSAIRCARSAFSSTKAGVSCHSSSRSASTFRFVKGWAQAGPHGFKIAGRRPRSWTRGGRVTTFSKRRTILCAFRGGERGLFCVGWGIWAGSPGPVNVTFKRPDKNTRGSSSQGVRGAGGGTVVDILSTPFLWVVVTIGLYGVAYWGYGKWIDRNVWRSSAKKATPAHMYMDGVEYFPVSRYVLWGYQFKSIAALGPILGPFIGITFGWLPALLWIIGGNFFIGWLQDYGAMMLSVRKEGRSFGPITYEFTGARGRANLLPFVLVFLILISATFFSLLASFL